MADVTVNGVDYPGVEAVTMQDANGNTTTFYPDAVRYNAQNLTPEQKAQARANIGAAAEGEGGGLLVQADWNQTDDTQPDFIRSKPFGKIKGDTLTWAFDIGGLDFESLPGGNFVKVSDDIVTMSDLANGCIHSSSLLGTLEFPAEAIIQIADGVLALPEFLCAFIDEAGVGVDVGGFVFPESGIYSYVELSVASLSIPGYAKFIATKKIDTQDIPDSCTQTVELYVSYPNDNGKRYIYYDFECTDAVTEEDMFDLIFKSRNLVVYLAENEVATVLHAHTLGITYLRNNYLIAEGEPDVYKAYTV